jgi:hypothetical protein
MVIVLGALNLKIPEFLDGLLDLILLHETESEVVLGLKVDLNELLLQLPHVGRGL